MLSPTSTEMDGIAITLFLYVTEEVGSGVGAPVEVTTDSDMCLLLSLQTERVDA